MPSMKKPAPARPRRRIQVRRSGVHGRGVFAEVAIAQGEIILEYAGEVIDWDEALRRHPRDPRTKGTRMTHALAYLLGGLFVLAAVKLDGWLLLLATLAITGALGAVLHLAQRQRLAALLQTRTAAYVRGWTESREETTTGETR